ncbi:MAG: glutamate--tRNA ligase family protein, partial [Planctomycetota bacterium]
MITRFAPSPTGPLHLGHAYAAIVAHDLAREAGGTFLVRMEDIDRSRARKVWEDAQLEDLSWLGLTWDAPPVRQSERLDLYEAAIARLGATGLLYPCTCNRRDIAAAASAPQEGAPLVGPDGIVYPGTCRGRP